MENWLPLWWLWSTPMLGLQWDLYCFRGTIKVTFKLYFVMKHNVTRSNSMLNWSKSFMCDDTFFILFCINESLVKRFVSLYGPWNLPWVFICRKPCGHKKVALGMNLGRNLFNHKFWWNKCVSCFIYFLCLNFVPLSTFCHLFQHNWGVWCLFEKLYRLVY